MKVAVPRETQPGERRVALVPESCKKLIAKGMQVAVESGAGELSFFSDDAYRAVGVEIETSVVRLLGSADFVLTVQPPTPAEVALYPERALLLGSLLPVKYLDTARALAARKITAFSTDSIPRTTSTGTSLSMSHSGQRSGGTSALWSLW